jgi:peptidylprolyl isomerase
MDPHETDPEDLAASAVSAAAPEVLDNEASNKKRCTRRRVLDAAKKQKYLSSQQKEDQYTARNASNHAGIMKASEGTVVKVEYTGSLEDGTVFDSNVGGEPLEFTIDEGSVIKGFNDTVKEMSIGDEKEVTLPPEQAYGITRQSLIISAPRANFPEHIKIGQTLALQGPNGQKFPGKIIAIGSEVTIDFNHPLAGKTLRFKIKLLDAKKPD